MLNGSGLLRMARLIELTSLSSNGIIITMVASYYRMLHFNINVTIFTIN